MNDFLKLNLPQNILDMVTSAPSCTVAGSIDEMVTLSTRDAINGYHEVGYDIPGKSYVTEATVCRAKNGVVVNYVEPYMRRRDPDCMVIADDRPTDKMRFEDLYGKDFSQLRSETFEWLKKQDLVIFPFVAGVQGKGIDAVAIVPANAGFFALALGMLQKSLQIDEVPKNFLPRAVIYVAPPFRHTYFRGKQIVVHNRLPDMYELYSYNLYPGPSAKKGVYGFLIDLGEQEDWITAHCSTVKVITPYDNAITLMHEGASGSGKSEMLEPIHREKDGRLLLGRNTVTDEYRYVSIPTGCNLRPITDDMALCHPSIQKDTGKLTVVDAEDSWFLRVNHIKHYGVNAGLEEITLHTKTPLLFFNIDTVPGGTALIWEHTEDAPGKPCPNPRVVLPRSSVPGIINSPVDVTIRSFGVRTPPCTKADPSYGIIGLFHILPPALGWLWRLVSPRGYNNPSIIESKKMSSEGVGSYWPFATGRRVDQANLLLRQFKDTPNVRYVLTPNQHIGAWEVGFMPQWIAREYLARRGGANFTRKQVTPARSPLLGYALKSIQVEGQAIGNWFLRVDEQPEVGPKVYDKGAKILNKFFHKQLNIFLEDDLHPLGRKIIECCLESGTLDDYCDLMGPHPILPNE